MTSVWTEIRGFVTTRPVHWVAKDRASVASVLATVALCLGALSGSTNTAAQGGGGTTPSSSPTDARAQVLALENTVSYLHDWSRFHLYQELRHADRSGTITSEARLRALRKVITGAAALHVGCESVEAKLIEPASTNIEIRANGCTFSISRTEASILAVAQGCVILAAPTGTVDAFLNQFAQEPIGPPLILVDSRAAGRGTWYLGPCL